MQQGVLDFITEYMKNNRILHIDESISREEYEMKYLQGVVATGMFFLSLIIGGCGGGGADVKTESSSYSTTLGQELKDLEDAYKKGIISEKEYNDAKKKLIEQRTK